METQFFVAPVQKYMSQLFEFYEKLRGKFYGFKKSNFGFYFQIKIILK